MPGTARWGAHRLAYDSVEALRTTGAFGTLALADFKDLYETRGRARASIRELQSAGLLRVESFRRGRRTFKAVTLTGKAARLLERSIDPREPGDESAQTYERGPARPSQVVHDLAVYRAARAETRRLRGQGRSVRRVLTERRLMALASRAMHAARQDGLDSTQARPVAAKALGLAVIDGQLAFPDVRLETGRRDGGPASDSWIDLEVVTADYRQRGLQQKERAGFTVYRADAAGGITRLRGNAR